MISVIIPFKNEERYIRECIFSIRRQTCPCFEVICVDDHSTDSTRQIIEALTLHDERFRIIDGNGKGAGAARNIGIHHATGDYIIFLDADDFFESDMLEAALNNMISANLDICIFNCCQYDDLTKTISLDSPAFKKAFLPADPVFAGTDTDKLFFITSGAPWNKLIRKTFFDSAGVRFMETVCFNDIYLIYVLLSKAARISAVTAPLLYYRTNNAASLQSNRWKQLQDAFSAFDRIYDELLRDDPDPGSRLAVGFRNFVLSCSFSFLHDAKSKEDSLNALSFIKSSQILMQLNREDVFDFLEDLYGEFRELMQSRATAPA